MEVDPQQPESAAAAEEASPMDSDQSHTVYVNNLTEKLKAEGERAGGSTTVMANV